MLIFICEVGNRICCPFEIGIKVLIRAINVFSDSVLSSTFYCIPLQSNCSVPRRSNTSGRTFRSIDICIIHINIATDTRNSTIRCILPKAVVSFVPARAVVLRNPAFIVIKNRTCQIVIPPVQVCINTRCIASTRNPIAKCLSDVCQITVTQQNFVVPIINTTRSIV